MLIKMLFFSFSHSEDRTAADLWLLNSCTVKSPAEDHFRNEITQAQKLDKKLVLAGCVPQGQPNAQYMHVSHFPRQNRMLLVGGVGGVGGRLW